MGVSEKMGLEAQVPAMTMLEPHVGFRPLSFLPTDQWHLMPISPLSAFLSNGFFWLPDPTLPVQGCWLKIPGSFRLQGIKEGSGFKFSLAQLGWLSG